jgi:hypothetical protein
MKSVIIFTPPPPPEELAAYVNALVAGDTSNLPLETPILANIPDFGDTVCDPLQPQPRSV